MSRGRRTELPVAALVTELGKTQGQSQRQIREVTGVSLGTVSAILNGAHGWDEIAEGDVFKRHRQEQNKALEQANRTLAKKSLEAAEGKMGKASYSQLVFGAAIMTDKARLLAGEPTQIIETVDVHLVAGLDKLAALLSQSLIDDPRTIDVTPSEDGNKIDETM